MKNLIKCYPVGNGDQSLLVLKDKTTILVDCNIRQSSLGSTDPKIYDVKKDLLGSIQKREGNPYIDIFVLTHGDQDHCRGFEENFYRGDPSNYKEKNRKAGEIIIDEMWFSPMIAEEHTNDDEEAYQREAERRIELHINNSLDKDLPGNRIRIVGYDGNKDYSALKDLRYTPGTVVTKFNNKEQSTFSIFIHAPFKEHLASAEKENKNTTSIVFQARFRERPSDSKFSGLAMFGGDADYIAWEVILERTVRYGNDKTESALDWDLFLAPHHCSWTFFNEHDNKDEPKESSLEILRYHRTGGKVISSSKKILNNDDNPPSYLAKNEYIKQLDTSANFLNTDTEPKEDAPEPLVFEITADGVKKLKPESETESDKLAAAISVASIGVIKKPWCY
jgi:hypothetical protein